METITGLLPLLIVLVPAVAALVIALGPERLAGRIANGSSLLALLGSLILAGRFDWSRAWEFQFERSIPVISEAGINLAWGLDAVSLWLVLLTAMLQPLCVWGSRTAITERRRTYYAWLTAIESAMLGVFVARDLIFFYVCFEFTLVPMFVLIALFGSTERRRAAIKFFLFTFTGSIIALAGLVYVAAVASRSGGWTFDIATLARAARGMSSHEQALVLLAMMAGFAVKVPLFPVHTWLPLAHTEAPTAGSVILAGVLLKLGTYAIFRFVLPFVPLAVVEHADLIAAVCIVGILYGGLICWVQRDVKKLIAYSSVAHLGFCMLGLFALNMAGGVGSVLYMLNHGLSTGALFFCVGMIYERYHTRSMREMEGLARAMPVWGFFFVFFAMASVGLPGLNGFVGEFLCLFGAFQSGAIRLGEGGTIGPLGPWCAAVAASGMIVAAMYLLYMVGKVVFGPLHEPHAHSHEAHGNGQVRLPRDLSPREIAVLTPLALGCLLLGVVPTPVIRTIEPSVRATLAPVHAAIRETMVVRARERDLREPSSARGAGAGPLPRTKSGAAGEEKLSPGGATVRTASTPTGPFLRPSRGSFLNVPLPRAGGDAPPCLGQGAVARSAVREHESGSVRGAAQ